MKAQTLFLQDLIKSGNSIQTATNLMKSVFGDKKTADAVTRSFFKELPKVSSAAPPGTPAKPLSDSISKSQPKARQADLEAAKAAFRAQNLINSAASTFQAGVRQAGKELLPQLTSPQSVPKLKLAEEAVQKVSIPNIKTIGAETKDTVTNVQSDVLAKALQDLKSILQPLANEKDINISLDFTGDDKLLTDWMRKLLSTATATEVKTKQPPIRPLN
jgi:hypothetical protein